MLELIGQFSIPVAGGLLAFLISLMSVGLLVATSDLHIRITGDPINGPQKLHSKPVPRIGGLGIALAISTATVALVAFTKLVTVNMLILIACTFPAFFAGFLDDLTNRVPTLYRLLATMLAALAISILFQLKFTHVGIPGIDHLLSIRGVGTAAFVFCVAGVAQAFNIIDGQNGLSAGTAVISLTGLMIGAFILGDPLTITLCAIVLGSLFGFLAYNYPRGHIFLGDGGAYLIGTIIAVLVIRFTETTSASPWFGLVLVIYPVWETVFSIMRRLRSGVPIDAADAHHLHSILFKKYGRKPQSFLWHSISPLCWAVFLPFVILSLLVIRLGQPLGLLAIVFIAVYSAWHYQLQKDHAELLAENPGANA